MSEGTPRTKAKSKSPRKSPELPGSWRAKCVSYDALKLLIKKGAEAQSVVGGANVQVSVDRSSEDDNSDNSLSESLKVDFNQWENVFSTKFQTELTKINSFYDDKLNDCMEKLKAIEHDVAHTFSRSQTVKRIQFWCDFAKIYIELQNNLALGDYNRVNFIANLEMRVNKIDDNKTTEVASIAILRKIVAVHSESLKVKNYGLYNLEVLKRVLAKYDKKIGVPVPDICGRLSSERFCSSSCDVFEKVVPYMKEIIRNSTPSVDDFSCSICLELLHKPTIIQCKHVFCASCLREVSTKFDFCPMCRTPQSLNPNHHVRDKPLEALLKQQFPDEYGARQKLLKAQEKRKKCIIM